jgi:hypothetical protein
VGIRDQDLSRQRDAARGRPGPELGTAGLVAGHQAAAVEGVDQPVVHGGLALELALALPADPAVTQIEADEASVVNRDHVVLAPEHGRQVHAPAAPIEVRVLDLIQELARDPIMDVEAGRVLSHVRVGVELVHRGGPIVVLREVREPALRARERIEGVHPSVGSAVHVDVAVEDRRRQVRLPLGGELRLEDALPGLGVERMQEGTLRRAARLSRLEVDVSVGEGGRVHG